MKYSPTDVARLFLPVREVGGPNKGNWVEAIQRWAGGAPGDSWCAEFVTGVLWLCFEGQPPIPLARACQTIYDLAKAKGWLTTTPVKDDVFLYVNDVDHAHHVGIVTDPGQGIAGNTSADGTSSNGDRVAEHGISSGPHVKYAHYPR